MMHETAEQKEIRMFNFYKKDLEKLGKENGYTILFDDSSISIAENEKKS